MRWWKAAGIAVLAAGSLAVSSPAIATACACGGLVSHDPSARVADEEALVAMNGDSETVIMRLNLLSKEDNAALVVPTPSPAKASSASPSIFDDLEMLSAEPLRAVPGGSDETGGAVVAAQSPTVVDQVQLGPLEATTLTGGDLAGVQKWLAAHGYTMRPDVVARLDPYLKQGWSFVAMRLTSPVPLNGQLDPVKLEFSSDRMVYPMRMSAAASTPQHVVIYTLGQQQMGRVDGDVDSQVVVTDYAGSIAGRATDQDLAALAAQSPFLTRLSVQIDDPGAITSDFQFAPVSSGAAYQSVVDREAMAGRGGLVLAIMAVGAGILGAGSLLVWMLLRRRHAPVPGPGGYPR